jgi:hypothetical protein
LRLELSAECLREVSLVGFTEGRPFLLYFSALSLEGFPTDMKNAQVYDPRWV